MLRNRVSTGEGPANGTHIPVNEVKQANVAIRALRRDDLNAFATWGHYDDPFGDWHQDPCHDTPDMAGEFSAHRNNNGETS